MDILKGQNQKKTINKEEVNQFWLYMGASSGFLA
jgi:hypothetical protein